MKKSLNVKEVNKYLAEGAECKELLISKNRDLRLADSMLTINDSINVRHTKEIEQHEVIEEKLTTENKKLNSDLSSEKEKTVTQHKRKKVWRGFAIGEAGLIVLIISILLL